jgi:hypothetical protein
MGQCRVAESGHKREKIGQANNQDAELSYYRTPEHRRLRAQLIQKWKPWERATGPRSEAGKAKVSQNSYKGGVRRAMRTLASSLKDQRRALKFI